MVSSEAKIKTFTFSVGSPAELIAGVVEITDTQEANLGTIEATVPYGTDVTAIAPTITVSNGATVAPVSGSEQDFSSDVAYVVTAEDGTTTRTYTATITVADAPSPAPVVTASANLGVKPRVPGWAGTRVFSGTIESYTEDGVDIGLGLFVPRFAISVQIKGGYTGYFDIATKKLLVYSAPGTQATSATDIEYTVILMGM
jgi:hypothetical protein